MLALIRNRGKKWLQCGHIFVSYVKTFLDAGCRFLLFAIFKIKLVLRNIISLAIISSLLSACSLFSPVQMEQTEYIIDSVPYTAAKKHMRAISILVPQPDASTIYNTTSMAYTQKPYEISYFAKNRWAATPPQMLQPLIVETLQNTHYFRSVGGAGALGSYDYVLHTEILEFNQEFFGNCSVMNVKLRAQVVKTSTNRVVATKEFAVIETAPQSTPYGGVVAANRAVSRILSQMAAWCVKQRL